VTYSSTATNNETVNRQVRVLQATAGYSGSDIRLVCKEAAMRPIRKIFDALENHTEGEIRHVDFTLGSSVNQLPTYVTHYVWKILLEIRRTVKTAGVDVYGLMPCLEAYYRSYRTF